MKDKLSEFTVEDSGADDDDVILFKIYLIHCPCNHKEVNVTILK